MKILILSQYFPPETGAPQNRLYNLAEKLTALGAEVEILTAFPNYPNYEKYPEHRGKIYLKEKSESGLEIHRSYIYVSKNKSIFSRLVNYFSFTISSFFIGVFKLGKFDIIICESPPLFLGISAVFLKWIKGSQLVFNVSDLWPESAIKLGLVKNKMIIALTTRLEEWIYSNSTKISGQTQGIVRDIAKRVPAKNIFWLRNGVDPKEIESKLDSSNWRKKNGFEDEDLLFYFGGLLGYAQGLDCIIHAAAKLKEYQNIKFVIVGEGPEKEMLINLAKDMGTENVYFFNGVTKNEVLNIIRSIDVAIVPLRKLDLFLGAIPSKIFEILYLKKPILLGVEGEAKELFIDNARAGLAFEPDNSNELVEKIKFIAGNRDKIISMGKNGHDYVCEKFDRSEIANSFFVFLKKE